MTTFYTEGILWYFFLIDSIIYSIMSFTQHKHHKTTHWLSALFPLNRFFALFYLILILWTGFTLYRMQIILFR